MVKRSNGPVTVPRGCGARTNPANARHALATTLLGAVLAASCTGVEDPPTPELRGATLDDGALEELAREAIAVREGVEPDALELVTQDALELRHSGVSARAFKFVDGPSGRWLAVTLVDGEPVDSESLLQAEEAARAALHGRLDPALHEQLVTAPPAGPLPVAIWLRHIDDGRCDDLLEPPMTRVRPGPLAGPMLLGIRPADNDGGELDVDADGEPIPPEVDGGDATDDAADDAEDDDGDDGDVPDEPIGPQPAEQPAGVDRAQVRAFSAALAQCRSAQMLATIAPLARRLETELGGSDAGPIVAQIVDADGTIRTPDPLPKGARLAQLYGVAPMIEVSLTAEEILELDQWTEIDTIYAATPAESHLAVSRAAVGVDHLHDWNVDGAGQRIGVIEVGGDFTLNYDDNPAVDMGLIFRDTTNTCRSSHSDEVVGVLHSQDSVRRGMTPDAELRLGGSCGGIPGESFAAATRAVAWGATVLNLSFGAPLPAGSPPGGADRAYDQLIFDTATTVVASAGNRGTEIDGGVGSPGLAYGVLTVGNYDDVDTPRWGDDVIEPTSSFRDPGSLHGDRNKPEIAAPGVIETTQFDDFAAGNGTSLAAPHVSGAAALLQQRDAFFEIFPEGVKAVLMASAIHNIEGATRISDRDGAGGLVVDNADNIFRGLTGDWDARLETCDEGNAHVVTTMPLRAGLRTRAVLVWGTEGNYGRYALEPSADLDLDVWAPGGVRVAASGTWENTYEIVEFTPTVSGPHNLRVFDFRCDGAASRRVAWAWVQEYPRGIEYAVELNNQGWGAWASNGASAGNPTGTRRIERFRSRGIGMPPGTNVEYQVRQTNVGWSPVRRNGEGAGVDGRKLQSLKMWLTNQPTGWGVRYRLDRPITGWTAWHEDGEEAGWNVLSSVKNAVQVTVVPAHEN